MIEANPADAPRPSDWPPPVLDAEGCALLLGLASGREALRLARRRVLPCVKIGKRRVFLLDSLLATLKARERPAIEDKDLNRCTGRRTVL